jgi:hypothetical protein
MNATTILVIAYVATFLALAAAGFSIWYSGRM